MQSVGPHSAVAVWSVAFTPAKKPAPVTGVLVSGEQSSTMFCPPVDAEAPVRVRCAWMHPPAGGTMLVSNAKEQLLVVDAIVHSVAVSVYVRSVHFCAEVSAPVEWRTVSAKLWPAAG